MIRKSSQQISPSLHRNFKFMKRILLFVFSFPCVAFGQDKGMLVEGSSPNLYISHTVAAKENFYSIGRLYNVSPKEIAPLNKLKLEKGLNPGQILKIPLISSNFFQIKTAANDKTLIPLYYVVKEKDGLYRIGANHNKLPVETLKKWNGLKKDEVGKGTKLVVGYLKVAKGPSDLVVKTDKIHTTDSGVMLEEKKPILVNENNSKAINNELPPVKIDDQGKPVTKEEIKKEEPKQKEIIPEVPPVIIPGTEYNGGIFKSLFDSQKNDNTAMEEKGIAGVFKSTSGWSDGKYYCLHNSAAPGTVIKITNSATGKAIFAKVLDIMPDIKQNNGLLIRISNSAAAQLGGGESNFNCTINYSK